MRVVGAHHQVYGVMQAQPPEHADDRPRVYLAEQGDRADELAYAAAPLAPGLRYNHVTTAAALPVLRTLLPGAAPLRWSTPAPDGLPVGYPVRIADGRVTLDLPAGVELEESAAYCARIARGDGVERIDPDGTVHFTAAARAPIAEVAPERGEPLPLDDAVLAARAERILALLTANATPSRIEPGEGPTPRLLPLSGRLERQPIAAERRVAPLLSPSTAVMHTILNV